MKPRTSSLTMPALAAGVLAAGACSVFVAPDEGDFQPRVVASVESAFADLLDGVDQANLRILRHGVVLRDTTMQPLLADGGIRVGAVLRPDEGRLGNVVELELAGPLPWGPPWMPRGVLFHGSTAFGDDAGWPYEAEIRLYPTGSLEVGSDRTIILGERIDLDTLEIVILPDGEARASEYVSWISESPDIVSIVDGEARAEALGSAEILAEWDGQTDQFTIQVQPVGTLVLSDSVAFHCAGTEPGGVTFGNYAGAGGVPSGHP